MSEKNMEFFLSNPEEFESLSEIEKAALFSGETLEQSAIEGETEAKTAEDTGVPAAEESPKDATTEQETPPVVLAKDGEHTIPYQELLDSREQAKAWEAKAKELAEAIAGMQKPENPEPAVVVDDISELRAKEFQAIMAGDQAEALKLRAQLDAALEARAEERAFARLKSEQSEAQSQSLFASEVDRITKLHPMLDANSDSKNTEAIQACIDFRDMFIAQGLPPHEALSKAAEKIVPLFRKTSTETAPPPTDASAKAAEAIAKAKVKPPVSLSEIPAGSAAHHDEAEAMRNMGSMDLMTKFQGKSANQIMELLSKVL